MIIQWTIGLPANHSPQMVLGAGYAQNYFSASSFTQAAFGTTLAAQPNDNYVKTPGLELEINPIDCRSVTIEHIDAADVSIAGVDGIEITLP